MTTPRASSTVTVLFLALVSIPTNTTAYGQQVENRVVLRVNNRIATLVDYQLRRDDRLRALAASDVAPEQREQYLESLGANVLGDMVEEMLLLSRADQLGVTAPRSAVEQEMAAARQRSGATTEAEFELALTRAGMTREDLQEQIETNVTIRQVINREIYGQLDLTEEDLRRYYFEHAEEFTQPERRRIREFVLTEDSGSPAELRAAAERVRSAIAAGADPTEAVAGEPLAGDWIEIGLVSRDHLDPSLAQAAWELQAGEISDPVEARGGLHVLQVTEVVPAELVDFDEVREEIGAREQQRLFAEKYQDYMDDLRRDSYVQINDLPEDALGFDLEASASRMTLTDLADTDSYTEETADAAAISDEAPIEPASVEPAEPDAEPEPN